MLDAKRQSGQCRYPYLANINVQWFRLDLAALNQMDFDDDDRVEFALNDGDLLVCEGGEVGRCAIWHNDLANCYFQKAIHRVRCNRETIIPEYLGYSFFYHSQQNGFSDIVGTKSTIAHLPGDKLRNMQIVVPPMEQQIRFRQYVEQADKSKLAIRQSLESLEKSRNALMNQIFG